MKKDSKQRFLVQEHYKEGKLSLFSFLQEQLKGTLSHKAIKRFIDAKRCKVNGQVVTISTAALKKGDSILLDLSPLEKIAQEQVILFEDAYLLILNKKVGSICDEQFVKPFKKEYPQLALVHRLDKETSGVLLLAKDEKTKEGMITLFKKHAVEKLYLAIVDGVFKKSEGKIENYLGQIEKSDFQITYGSVTEKEGKRAITHYRILKKSSNASLLLCQPITGRTHQLRVHLSSISHPILGDWQYGKQFICKYEAQSHLLHAYKVEFIHPVTKEKLQIKAPLPKEFDLAVKELFPSS